MLWEEFLSQLRGARIPHEIRKRAITFFNEAFQPGECVLVWLDSIGGNMQVVGWSRESLSHVQMPSAEERKRLLLRWGEHIDQVRGERRVIRHEQGDSASFLFPLQISERCQGVLILADVSLGLAEVRILQPMVQEIAERLDILEGRQVEGVTSGKDLSVFQHGALSRERQRADELESMLLQVTQEAERRSKDLELMRERWLSEMRFNKSVLESLSSGLISLDSKGMITYFNRGAEQILQYSADEVLGRPLGVAMACKDKRDILDVEGPQDEPFLGRQIQVMRKDGTEIPMGINISPHLDTKNREIGKIIHFRDLTKTKEMQEELMRIGRLGSLGEISMGIAHEIRNPLAGIRITAQALEEEVKGNKTLREYVARIISEIDRLNELVKSFLSFAKPQKPELVPCHVPELIRDVLFLVKKDLEERQIQVDQDHADDLPTVSVDVNQMKQVFLNLILNSLQAITKRGEIRVRTSVHSQRDRQEILIRVSDTGKGIPREHLAKVFDPFFTTKAKGLGMGLSNVYRIIDRHDGHIRVQSEPDEGTTFFIHLPIDHG